MSPAWISIIILLVMIAAYMSNKVPLPLIPLTANVVMVLFGIMTPGEMWAYYSNDTFMLIVGMMVLGLALFETGVAEKIGLGAVKLSGGKSKLAFLLLLVAAIIASAFLSNTTTTATFMPILAGLIASAGGVLHEKKTMMPLAIAACVGGNLSLIGSTPQVIFQGLFEDQGMATFRFFEYAKIGLPLVAIFLIYQIFISDKIFDKMYGDNPERSEVMQDMLGSLEKSKDDPDSRKTWKMVVSVLIFAITVVCMIAINSSVMPTGSIAMMGAIASMILVIPVKTTIRKLDWSTLIFFGAVMAFATGFGNSGAGQMIADAVVNLGGANSSPFLIFAIFCAVIAILTQFMNNTGVAAMFAPIAFSIAATLGVSVYPFAMGVIIASSISISTPIATSPMTLVVGMGGYKFMDYVKVGGLLNLVMLIVSIVLIPVIWPF